MWATEAADGTIHVVVINQDATNEHDVAVTVPGQTATGTIESLTAPSISATSGVQLGAQTYGAKTTTGTLPTPTQSSSTPTSSVYTIPAPPASAQMLMIPPPSSAGGGRPIGH